MPPVRRKRPPRAPPTKRVSRRPKSPRLHIYTILAWADAHYRRTGRWPTSYSGEVRDAPWDTWRNIDYALRRGYRGCRGDSSLPRLLHRHRGRPLPLSRPRPRLTVRKILAWADAHHHRTGRWPSQHSRGPVVAGRADTWCAVNIALTEGGRGLPGGDSLAKILLRYRGVRRARYRPRLTIAQILTWADRYHARHGRWPHLYSGRIAGAAGDTWAAIHTALENAGRGLPRGYTLATLLARYRGVRYIRALPRYTGPVILAWADAHHGRCGRWPTLYSGPIPEAPGETWRRVEGALSKGHRGLPGGDTLSRFLMRHGRRPHRDWRRKRPLRHERLSGDQILAWADEFHRQNGCWPATRSGPIAGTRDETWRSVDLALREGLRGLPGGSSVALLLAEQRGARHKHHRPRIANRDLLTWADAYHDRAGRWPTPAAGLIPESSGDTWRAVESALRNGLRGRPGGDTLLGFLRRAGRIPADDPRIRRSKKLTGAGGPGVGQHDRHK